MNTNYIGSNKSNDCDDYYYGDVDVFYIDGDDHDDDNDMIRMEVASSRPDYLPTLSAAKASKHSLLVKHHMTILMMTMIILITASITITCCSSIDASF